MLTEDEMRTRMIAAAVHATTARLTHPASEDLEEMAAMLEYQNGLPRHEAERLAREHPFVIDEAARLALRAARSFFIGGDSGDSGDKQSLQGFSCPRAVPGSGDSGDKAATAALRAPAEVEGWVPPIPHTQEIKKCNHQ